MTTTAKGLACPSCKSTTALGTIERLYGIADAAAIHASGDVEHLGWFEIDWNGPTTVGVACRNCDWSFEGDDWVAQLTEEDS
jgi:hypothetical protein